MVDLPYFEQTLGDLILDLLRSAQMHPELLLSEPLSERGEPIADAVRLTQHYTAALLAYGFTAETEELSDAAAWFAAPFPNDWHPRMDSYEMNRLEALLSLGRRDEPVQMRLEQLLRQRTADGFFDVQAGGPDFDTLWALKVMVMAKDMGMLNGTMPAKDLDNWSSRVVRAHHREKDLALALHLRHRIAGKYTVSQKKQLDNLMNMAGAGVWGLSQDMLWIADHMKVGQLTPGEVADHRETVREMVLSTCYVVENVAPLMNDYPEVRPLLRQAVELWWGVFHGKDADDVLHTLFPMPYDTIMVTARTLVSLRAFVGKPLIQWGAAHVHRQLAQQHVHRTESPDNEFIRLALRNWLEVDLEEEPRKLRLGMSDSNVVQVRPLLRNPMLPDDDTARIHIPYASSLVVKYGPVDEINRERENYAALPPALRDSFVKIPQPTYVDDQRRRAYVIMADLANYQTLYDMIMRVPQMQEALARELGPFLLNVHRGDTRQKRMAPWGLLWQLYLLPMQEHVERIFNYVRDNNLLERKVKLPMANELQRTLLDLLGNLVRYQMKLEAFPLAYMHGDLHTRNVMVRKLKRDSRIDAARELDFKLIDLEKLRRDGDCALDAGEILVDIELAMGSMRQSSDRRPLQQLADAMWETYGGFAEERRDASFQARVQLARARAIIRVAKGRTKAGEVALRESRRGQAIGIAHEALRHAEAAVEYLTSVLKAFGG